MLTLIFLLCAGCGVIYLLDLIARRSQILQMRDLIQFLHREIRLSHAPLNLLLKEEQAINGIPILREMDFSDPFDLHQSYEKAKRSCKGEMFFTDEEWRAADRLFLSIGQGDVSEQESCLSFAQSAFSQSEERVRDAIGKQGKSAIVLGCSMGAVLVLMLL